jgi:hypothetical protein
MLMLWILESGFILIYGVRERVEEPAQPLVVGDGGDGGAKI